MSGGCRSLGTLDAHRPAASGDRVEPVDAITATVLAHPVVWVVEAAHTTPEDVNRISALGYHVADTIRLHRTDVYELTKDIS